jgi:arylsulfatase A-like enzyme
MLERMPSVTRRQLLAAAAGPFVLSAQRRAGDQPNLLFLWTDEQRPDTFAAYGNHRFRMPTLNRLARESVIFERNYVTQPVCTPSRSSIMTGLWPHQTGCLNNNIPLRPETPAIPELMGAHGYRTAYMGKWHLGDEVFAQHGFQEWVSIEDGYNRYYRPGRDANAVSSYHQWLTGLGYRPENGKHFSRDWAVRRKVEHCKPAFLASEASRFILESGTQPWLLSVNFLEPHMPFFGPYNDLHSEAEAPVPPNYPGGTMELEPESYRKKRKEYYDKGFEGHDLKSRPGWQRLNRNYAGLCAQVDQALGRILWALEASGQMENTLIVFTSDHGEMMGAHGLIGKSVMYEEAMRVPLLIRAPFLKQAPQRIQRNTSSIDIVPTVLDLLNRKPAAPVSGHSLRPLMSGGPHPEPFVFSQWNHGAANPVRNTTLSGGPRAEGAGEGGGANARTVISPEGLKLVLHDKDHSMLLDRRSDPLETRNLIRDSSRGADIARLKKEIERWMIRQKDPLLEGHIL